MHRNLAAAKRAVCAIFIRHAASAAAVSPMISLHSSEKIKRISKAMIAFIERSQAREAFLQREKAQFELGKRHLANMMGVDAETMTQNDVDEAIAYLLPSGLFHIGARPVMKSPEFLYPPEKPVQFNEEGRPYHSLFFTGSPNFYQIIYDIRERILKLQAYEDHQYAKGAELPTDKLTLGGTDWLSVEYLHKMTLETITPEMQAQLAAAGNALLALPYSFLEADFITKLRYTVGQQIVEESRILQQKLKEQIQVTEDGRQTVSVKARVREVESTVKLTSGGTGKVIVDGQKPEDFIFDQSRENLLFPFILLNRLGQFDVETTSESTTGEYVHVDAHGESVLVASVRYGISQCLLAFISEEEAEKLRLAGLLSRDPKKRERRKYGQPRARAKWIWKKR